MKKVMYSLPKYLAVVPLGVAIFFIISALFVSEPATCVGYGGEFFKRIPKIFGLTYYWFFLILGIVVTIAVSILRREKYGFNLVFSIAFPILFFLQALVGAKFLFAIEKVINARSIAAFDMSGQSLYGTLITTFPLAPLVAVFMKKKVLLIYDYMSSLWMILLIFCRIGCFTDGCCGARLIYVLDKPLILPVQLFEMFFDIIILAVLFYWEEKKLNWAHNKKKKKNNSYNGILFFAMLIMYGVCRFMLEFIRDNPRIFLGMSFGHIYSLIFIIVGAVFLYFHRIDRTNLMQKDKTHNIVV